MGFFNDLFRGNFSAIANDAVRDTGEFLSGQAPLIEGGGFLGNILNMGAGIISKPLLSVIPSSITGGLGQLMQNLGGGDPSLPANVTVPTTTTQTAYTVGSKVTASDGKTYELKSDGTWGDINLGDDSMMYLIGGIVVYLFLKKKKIL